MKIPTTTTDGDTSCRRSIVYLLIGIITLGVFTAYGNLNFDTIIRYKIAQSMVDHGDVQLRISSEEMASNLGYNGHRIEGPDGKVYSRYSGIGQSLVLAGPYFLFRHLFQIDSEQWVRSLICIMIFPLMLGLTGWLFYLLLREFGFTSRASYLLAIMLIVGTGLWQLSKETQDDSHLAVLYTLVVYALKRYQNSNSLQFLALSAVAMAAAFLFRSDTAPTIVCYLVFTDYLIHQNSTAAFSASSRLQKTGPYLLVVALMALDRMMGEAG